MPLTCGATNSYQYLIGRYGSAVIPDWPVTATARRGDRARVLPDKLSAALYRLDRVEKRQAFDRLACRVWEELIAFDFPLLEAELDVEAITDERDAAIEAAASLYISDHNREAYDATRDAAITRCDALIKRSRAIDRHNENWTERRKAMLTISTVENWERPDSHGLAELHFLLTGDAL